LYVKLNKTLFGCVQSAKMWHDKLCNVLEEDGYDWCLFIKTVDGVQLTIAFYVDDLLITSVSGAMVDDLEKLLKRKFEAITVTRANKHSYLAMNLELTEDGTNLDMIAYIKSCLRAELWPEVLPVRQLTTCLKCQKTR
jgi:hypothetical protein